jgi:single-strand DNA-binding protein
MSGLNKVMLIGNLGNDPDLKYTSNGTPVCKLSVATNEKYVDRNGNEHNNVEWHRVVAWRKLGEICGKFLSKGRQVYVEGKLTTRKWDDKDGVTRYTTEIIAQRVQFLGGNGKTAAANQKAEEAANQQPANQPPDDDNIPF